MPTRRNPVVRAGAILRKGGVHRQSASGHRHQGKRKLVDEIADWYEEACVAGENRDNHVADPHCAEDVQDSEQADCQENSKRGKGWSATPGALRTLGPGAQHINSSCIVNHLTCTSWCVSHPS